MREEILITSLENSSSTIKTPSNHPKAQSKKNKWLTLFFFFAIMLIVSFGYFLYKQSFIYKNNITIGSIKQISKTPQEILKTDDSGDRTNILIVGKDTRTSNHALQNTDTILLLSYNYKTHTVVGISIPRDLFIQVPDSKIFTRINAVYEIGEKRKKGEGLPLLKEVVENVTGLKIQYYVMVDLKGFRDAVDLLGGIDVDVENSFTDYYYPSSTPGQRYETVSFSKGLTHMDGDTALKFVRSRHSLNPKEGSDFGRARRQQKVLIAIKNKLLEKQTFLNPVKIVGLLQQFNNNITISSINTDEIQAGIQLLKQNDYQFYSFVLDPLSGNGQLLTDKSQYTGNAYGIVPIKGPTNYTDIHAYVKKLIEYPDLYSKSPLIYTYNTGLGYQNSYIKTKQLIKEFPFLNIKYLGTLYNSKNNCYIFTTQEELQNLPTIINQHTFKNCMISKPDFLTTNPNHEDISILFGLDQKKEDEQ